MNVIHNQSHSWGDFYPFMLHKDYVRKLLRNTKHTLQVLPLLILSASVSANAAPISRTFIQPENTVLQKTVQREIKIASRTYIGPETDKAADMLKTVPAEPAVILPDLPVTTPQSELFETIPEPVTDDNEAPVLTISPETQPALADDPADTVAEIVNSVLPEIQLISPEEGATLTLTPIDAARLAVANNTDLLIAFNGTEQSQAQYLRALGIDDINASLSGRAGMQHSGGGAGTDSYWSAGLSLSKVLLAAGGVDRSQEAAAASVQSSQLNETSVRRLLNLAGYEATFKVLQMRQLVKVAVDEANALQAHLKQTEDQLVAGTVAKFEVLQAQTELARAQGNVITANTNYIQALSALKRLLMLPQETVIAIVDGPEIEFSDATQVDLIAQAVARRPEVQQAELAVRIAELNQKIAQGTRDPTVSLNGSLNESSGSSGLSWEIAVSVQKPILDGRELQSEKLNANAKFRTAQAQLTAIQADVAQEVVDQYTAVQNALERLRVAQLGVVEAIERRDIAVVRFNTQYGLGIEVVDAEVALTAAQADRINAMYDLQTAQIKLLSITGASDVL